MKPLNPSKIENVLAAMALANRLERQLSRALRSSAPAKYSPLASAGYDLNAKSWRLRGPSLAVLLVIDPKDGAQRAQVREQVGMGESTLTDAIARLVEAGLIARPKRKAGRRTVRLRLTEIGALTAECIRVGMPEQAVEWDLAPKIRSSLAGLRAKEAKERR